MGIVTVGDCAGASRHCKTGYAERLIGSWISGIAWIMLLYLASGIFVTRSNRISDITTRLAPT